MQLRLRSSIILVVIVGLLIPVSVSSYLALGQRQNELRQKMTSDHERFTEILSLGMDEPLWNISPAAGLPLFESILRDRRIVGITVVDNKKHEFLSRRYPERIHGRVFNRYQKIFHDNTDIGSVKVEMDSGQLDSEIASGRWIFAGTVVGQILLSLILIVALLQRRMLVPIKRLMLESERLARRELAEPFTWKESDELGSLGASLEHTRQALQGLFREIETKNDMLQEDILRRETIEKELQRHRDHLEDLVKERTIELQAAKERADVANQAKSTFLSSMTHELRTPLNAILGYAQILRRDKALDERQKIGLSTIQQSGEHLLTLITDLLDLAKIEAGKFELMPAPVSLLVFLDGIVNIIRVKAEQKELQFIFDTAGDIPDAVVVDEKRLRQILLNLLGNAVKFTDAGQVIMRVSGRPATDHTTCLYFEIKDSGVGMSATQLEHIFKPFEQVGDIQRKFGGTGLGLSISRQLVRLMGSDIAVASELGIGSRFSFELNIPTAEKEMSAVTDDRLVVGYQGARKKILIVDDIAANRDMLTDLLNHLGFDVETAKNGLEGVEKAIAIVPDAILMDIVMPVMDGFQAIRRIRSTPGIAHVCIVAISASVTSEEQHEAVVAGAHAFMSKPVEQNHLLEHLGAFLGLDLIYDMEDSSTDMMEVSTTLIAPPEKELDTLYQLAMAGNMREIRQHADHIEALDSQYKAFAEKLRHLARTYQSKAILELASEYATKRGLN